MSGKMKDKEIVRVAVYYGLDDLPTIVAEAEKLGFRRVGIPIKNKKPHGFNDEWIANLDGVSRYLKYTEKYYREHEAERLQELARLMQEEKELAEKKKKLGGV